MALVKSVAILYAASSIMFAFGCAMDPVDDNAEGAVVQASRNHTEIHSEDDCDPVTFGSLCKAGFPGQTTLSAFIAELQATQVAAKWEYGGGQARVALGSSFQVDNVGGETHTFSVVANFGGGRVGILNDLSGNTTVAPECVNGPTATNVDIAAGGGLTVTTGATGAMKARGTFKVQCCIHPWMRTTVVIQ